MCTRFWAFIMILLLLLLNILLAILMDAYAEVPGRARLRAAAAAVAIVACLGQREAVELEGSGECVGGAHGLMTHRLR